MTTEKPYKDVASKSLVLLQSVIGSLSPEAPMFQPFDEEEDGVVGVKGVRAHALGKLYFEFFSEKAVWDGTEARPFRDTKIFRATLQTPKGNIMLRFREGSSEEDPRWELEDIIDNKPKDGGQTISIRGNNSAKNANIGGTQVINGNFRL